jgi:hypothetical protein
MSIFHGRETERFVFARVLFITNANKASLEKLHDSCEHFIARQRRPCCRFACFRYGAFVRTRARDLIRIRRWRRIVGPFGMFPTRPARDSETPHRCAHNFLFHLIALIKLLL